MKKVLLLLKTTRFLYALSNVFFLATLFIMDVIIARNYNITEVGIWKQILLMLQFTIPFFGLGLLEGYRYKISQQKDNIGSYTLSMLLILLALSFLIFIFFNIQSFVNKIVDIIGMNAILDIAPYLFILFLLLSLEKILQFLAIAQQKVSVVFWSFLSWSIFFFFSFFFFSYLGNVKFVFQLFYALIIAYLLQIFIYVFLLRLTISRNIKIEKVFEDIKEFLKFGFPLFIASYIGLLTLHVDKIIINKIGGIETFAIYSVGAFELPIVALIVKVFTSISFPLIVEKIASNNIKEAEEIWLKDLTTISYLTYPLIFLCIVFSKFIITGIFGSQYEASVPIFKAYCLILLWRNSAYGTLMSLVKGSKYVSMFSGIAFIINIILVYVLMQYLGIIGSIYATFLAITALHLMILKKEGLLMGFFLNYKKNPKFLFLTLLIWITYFCT